MSQMNEYIRIDHDSMEDLNVFGAYGWRPVLRVGRHIILERPIPEDKWEYVKEYYAKRSRSKNLDEQKLERPLLATNS